jgi:hypothetical protein
MPTGRVKEAAEHRGPVEAGKQSQSTEPSRLTSAAERQSESSAYSPIGKLPITASSRDRPDAVLLEQTRADLIHRGERAASARQGGPYGK